MVKPSFTSLPYGYRHTDFGSFLLRPSFSPQNLSQIAIRGRQRHLGLREIVQRASESLPALGGDLEIVDDI